MAYKSKQIVSKRREYIRNEINKARQSGKSIPDVVSELSERLFLSDRTIYRDYTAA